MFFSSASFVLSPVFFLCVVALFPFAFVVSVALSLIFSFFCLSGPCLHNCSGLGDVATMVVLMRQAIPCLPARIFWKRLLHWSVGLGERGVELLADCLCLSMLVWLGARGGDAQTAEDAEYFISITSLSFVLFYFSFSFSFSFKFSF